MPVNAIFDTDLNLWEIEGNPEYGSNLTIGFRSSHGFPRIKNYKTGWSSYEESGRTQSKNYPVDGAKFRKTDQPHVVIEKFEAKPDSVVGFSFWVETHEGVYQEEYSVTIPKPSKPYESWVWDESKVQWVAPVPFPDNPDWTPDWDESIGQWVPREKEFSSDEDLF